MRAVWPRGQLWPTGSVGAGHRASRPWGTGSVGDSVGEGRWPKPALRPHYMLNSETAHDTNTGPDNTAATQHGNTAATPHGNTAATPQQLQHASNTEEAA